MIFKMQKMSLIKGIKYNIIKLTKTKKMHFSFVTFQPILGKRTECIPKYYQK